MCGIFGYVGSVSAGEKSELLFNLISAIAIASERRGEDSTGFSARFDSGFIVTDKMPFRASVFCDLSHKYKNLSRRMPSTMIGHTRFGTGSSPIVNNNNHPFFGTNYHMVHNGVIPSWRDVVKDNQLVMSSETDSEVIIRLLEKKNKEFDGKLKKSVEWVLDNVWGNMAVALLEKKRPTIWLFRNENPIHIFRIPKRYFGSEILIFSSTKHIFDDAWKDIFDSPSPEDISSRLLEDNQLFRVSTTGLLVNGAVKHFTMSRLTVKNKFRLKKQYYGCTVGASDESGRYMAYTPATNVFSKVVDVNDVSKGCLFTKEQEKTINNKMREKDGEKRLYIDGCILKEYAGLKTFVSKMISTVRANRSEQLVVTP